MTDIPFFREFVIVGAIGMTAVNTYVICTSTSSAKPSRGWCGISNVVCSGLGGLVGATMATTIKYPEMCGTLLWGPFLVGACLCRKPFID